ncbi:NADPH:quinone reductase [Lentzea jiangxiensis]|uniref:NADPH:quinone reductase n=2 Tax=Lentzea jiangxiensis TaxID=641025 RepID=A0A1H0SJP7_9PSEU|nr:NADPH:quinone reductase [Lentzea jiangxiensis]
MKAVVLKAFGGAENLVLTDLPDPRPRPGEVLVEVQAAGVGHVDVMSRRGEFGGSPSPGLVPGIEVAGVVVGTGEDVDDAWVGRRVHAMLDRTGGGYAELVAADVEAVVALPDQVGAAEAVALGFNALTAWTSLERAGVRAADKALVRGAGGGVGLMAVLLGIHLGATVTAVTSSASRGERLAALGVPTVVNRLAVAQAYEEHDIIIDPVGGPEFDRFLEKLAPNGRYVLCGGAAGFPTPDFGSTLLGRFTASPTLLMLSLSSISRAELRARMEKLLELVAGKTIASPVDGTFPLAAAAHAHDRLESGAAFGKIVLVP